MSILHGRDLLSSKYITAVIIDNSDRAWFVPVKYHIGDYFVAMVNGQRYVFSLGGRKFTYQDTLVRSFQFMIYTTAHYKPVSPPDNKLMELITIANDLPKVNILLFSILKILGKREKNKFEVHKLSDLEEYIKNETKKPENRQDKEFIEQANSIINYLSHLKISEIITPVRKLTEFLEDDLIATDPKYPGNCIDAVVAAEEVNKKINNVPTSSKTPWMKVIAIMALIGLVGAVVYIAYSQGAFDVVTKPFEGLSDFSLSPPPSATEEQLIKKYPTPESMRAAIDSGELKYNTLPPNIKRLVDSVPSVKATP